MFRRIAHRTEDGCLRHANLHSSQENIVFFHLREGAEIHLLLAKGPGKNPLDIFARVFLDVADVEILTVGKFDDNLGRHERSAVGVGETQLNEPFVSAFPEEPIRDVKFFDLRRGKRFTTQNSLTYVEEGD